MPDKSIQELIMDLHQTPGIRRAAIVKGRLLAEGSIALAELKRGRLDVSLRAALNRLRGAQGLKPLPFESLIVDWFAEHPLVLEFRIYPSAPIVGPT